MNIFSEESKLLVKNWDTVEDIFNAEKRLRKEMSDLLLSIEPQLSKNSWWQNGWVFNQYQESQVYISNQHWQINNDFAIWIGVENFTPTHIFGVESPPTLYVWTAKKQYDLAQMLVEQIEKSEYKVLGEVDHRVSGYVVKANVKKCLPEEVEEFGEVTRKQIVDFFTHSARLLWNLNTTIQNYLTNLKIEDSIDNPE